MSVSGIKPCAGSPPFSCCSRLRTAGGVLWLLLPIWEYNLTPCLGEDPLLESSKAAETWMRMHEETLAMHEETLARYEEVIRRMEEINARLARDREQRIRIWLTETLPNVPTFHGGVSIMLLDTMQMMGVPTLENDCLSRAPASMCLAQNMEAMCAKFSPMSPKELAAWLPLLYGL